METKTTLEEFSLICYAFGAVIVGSYLGLIYKPNFRRETIEFFTYLFETKLIYIPLSFFAVGFYAWFIDRLHKKKERE